MNDKFTKLKDEILDRYVLEKWIEHLEDVIDGLEKSFIVDCTGYIPAFSLESRWHDYVYCDIQECLLYLSGNDEGEIFDIEWIKDIADEDEEWTKERNEELAYIAYRKFTLKPHFRDKARNVFENTIKEMKEALNEMNQKCTEYSISKRTHRIGTVYSLQKPSGGEEGCDGFMDAEIIHIQTNTSTRVIYRDIFDVGIFSLPKRLYGTEDGFNSEMWTKEERDACDWIVKFGSFSKIVRM